MWRVLVFVPRTYRQSKTYGTLLICTSYVYVFKIRAEELRRCRSRGEVYVYTRFLLQINKDVLDRTQAKILIETFVFDMATRCIVMKRQRFKLESINRHFRVHT